MKWRFCALSHPQPYNPNQQAEKRAKSPPRSLPAADTLLSEIEGMGWAMSQTLAEPN